MDPTEVKFLKKQDSLEEFEFCDLEGDLEIDLSKSPVNVAAEQLTSGIGLVIAALCTIVEEQNLVVKIPVQAVAATAVGALTGSLLGGPPGLAVGLVTGAVIAYKTSPKRLPASKSERGEEKISIYQIFRQMTFQQKKELIQELMSCLKQSSVRGLIMEILKTPSIRHIVLEILSNFLMKKMKISLVRPTK